MSTFCHFEQRIANVKTRHPEMPTDAVVLVRLAYATFKLLNARLESFFAEQGFSVSAWSLLILIYSDPKGEMTPSEASETLMHSRAHMTRASDELVELGLIHRVGSADDRRRIALRLTPTGEGRVQELLPQLWAFYRQLIGELPPETVGLMTEHLHQWFGHLAQLSPCKESNHGG